MFTARDLQDMTAVSLALDDWSRILGRQQEAYVAIRSGRCTPGCVGALDQWGPCECTCGGAFHSQLWIDTVALDWEP